MRPFTDVEAGLLQAMKTQGREAHEHLCKLSDIFQDFKDSIKDFPEANEGTQGMEAFVAISAISLNLFGGSIMGSDNPMFDANEMHNLLRDLKEIVESIELRENPHPIGKRD